MINAVYGDDVVLFQKKKRKKILWMGYGMPWHHSQMMLDYLKKSPKYEVVFINLAVLCSNQYIVDYVINGSVDYVFCGMADARIDFMKMNLDTKIITYAAESYWSPGALNPDYLITCFPELISRFKKMNPEIFHTLIGYWNLSCWINPAMYNPDKPKRNRGIHFTGILKSKLGKTTDHTGGGCYRLYREAYSERKEIVEANPDLITFHDQMEYSDYVKWLEETDACLVAHSYMSYDSKRPLENACAGVVNVFYIRDEYERAYYEQRGWAHNFNCYMFEDREGLFQFGRLSMEQKKAIRSMALAMVMSEYTPEKVFEKMISLVEFGKTSERLEEIREDIEEGSK